MAPCFQDSVCFAVYARMIPHTYPTSENSATLPLSACQEHEVITDLVGLFLSPCCDTIFLLLEIYKYAPYCNWFTVPPSLNFPFPRGAWLLSFFSSVHCPSLNTIVADCPNE